MPTSFSPPARSGFSLVPWQNDSLLLFGGDAANGAATEWSWNGIEWQPVVLPVPRRDRAAVAARGDDVFVFGGVDGAGVSLTDTWSFENGVWTQIATPSSPPPLTDMSMAAEPVGDGLVLLGRNAGSLETWRFANGTWTQLPAAVLTPGATSARLFADTVRGEVDAFVTSGASLLVLRLDGAVWTPLAQGAANAGLVAFDAERGRAVVVDAGNLWATQEWDGSGLSPQAGTIALPTNLAAAAVAFHAARHETIFVDGNGPLAVRRWAPQPVPLATAFGAACQDPTFRLGLVAGDSPQPGALHRLEAVGASTSALQLSLLGFSHTLYAGVPLPATIPLGTLGCQLRVEALVLTFLGAGLPKTQAILVPASTGLLGQRYDAQVVQIDATGVVDASNGLEVQIGAPLAQNALVETFASAANRDANASGDAWGGGNVSPVAIGGDGRHGSFDAAFGQFVNGAYVWSTDQQSIPASNTLDGTTQVVTDGKFYFTDLVVPAGTTVRFVGANPAQLFVRGRVDVQGTIDVSAADMPFWVPPFGPATGQRVSTFNATVNASGVAGFSPGQPGGAPGCGGGRGGDGAEECQSTGPQFVGAQPRFDGRPGEDVRLCAGHAYAAAAVDTGGRGGVLWPASGLTQNTPLMGTLYRPHFSRGGTGGGFVLPGGSSVVTPLIGSQPSTSSLAGSPFPLLPFPASPPAGYQSVDHFLVGGSGGGGGGSHPFGTQGFLSTATVPPNVYLGGHGGTGGGGALALRAGGDLTVAAGAVLRSKGGTGVLVNGDNPNTPTIEISFGISSPGGGGSGGSFVLQSAADVQVAGQVDTTGSAGSRTGAITPATLNLVSQAGAGSPGFYRLEAAGLATFTGTGVPAFQAAVHQGALTDRDDRTGSRSRWMLPASAALPVYLRYELVVDIAGSTVLFSDDPNVSALAADDPNGAVVLRLQGAQIDAFTGNVVPATIGPWRTTAAPGESSVNRDRARAVRFDLVLDKSFGPVSVRELRIVWR